MKVSGRKVTDTGCSERLGTLEEGESLEVKGQGRQTLREKMVDVCDGEEFIRKDVLEFIGGMGLR